MNVCVTQQNVTTVHIVAARSNTYESVHASQIYVNLCNFKLEEVDLMENHQSQKQRASVWLTEHVQYTFTASLSCNSVYSEI